MQAVLDVIVNPKYPEVLVIEILYKSRIIHLITEREPFNRLIIDKLITLRERTTSKINMQYTSLLHRWPEVIDDVVFGTILEE